MVTNSKILTIDYNVLGRRGVDHTELDEQPTVGHVVTHVHWRWRFTLGPMGGTGLQVVARHPNLAVLLTHCGQLILRKI